jgi:hypothetical protein
MRYLHAIKENAVLQFRRIANHAAIAHQNAAAQERILLHAL